MVKSSFKALTARRRAETDCKRIVVAEWDRSQARRVSACVRSAGWDGEEREGDGGIIAS